MSLRRTHDRAIYLNESRYERPKEIFKLLADRIERFAPHAALSIGNFGCAAGEVGVHSIFGDFVHWRSAKPR